MDNLKCRRHNILQSLHLYKNTAPGPAYCCAKACTCTRLYKGKGPHGAACTTMLVGVEHAPALHARLTSSCKVDNLHLVLSTHNQHWQTHLRMP